MRDAEQSSLKREVDNEHASQLFWGKLNNVVNIVTTIAIIASSAVATALVAAKSGAAPYIAAVPALLASFQNVVDLRGKAVRYYITARRYGAISRMMAHAGLSDSAAVTELNKIDEEAEARWLDAIKNGSNDPASAKEQRTAIETRSEQPAPATGSKGGAR